MAVTEQQCPRCGAPAPKQQAGIVYCAYCSTPLVFTRDGFQVSPSYTHEDLVDPGQTRFWVGGHRYRVQGRIGEGETSDVFLALRDHRLTERVVVKCLRAHEDKDLAENEWEALTALQRSTAKGSPHFTRLLPHPVAHGVGRLGVRGQEGERTFSVYGFASGFVHTFLDVRAQYGRGIPATAAVWLWKRVLELASFVHESGFVHASLVPRHLLVHARDHGVRMCGWSTAVPNGQPLNAFPDADAGFCSAEALAGGAVGPGHDISTSARSILWLLGGHMTKAPGSTPSPLADLLERAAAPDAGGFSNAWAVRDQLTQVAESAFGPRRFVPFPMPGWPRVES